MSKLTLPVIALSFATAMAGAASAQDRYQDRNQGNPDTQSNRLQNNQNRNVGGDTGIAILRTWDYGPLYRGSWSMRDLMDNAEVYGPTGEEIGSIENFVLARDGTVAGIIAQVGGFWDIGDTHVFVPMDQVRTSRGGDRVTIPVTQDTVENYSTWAENYLTRGGTGRWQTVDDDVRAGAGLWKATQLIGDDAFDNNDAGFGTVQDILFRNGKVTAVVLSAYAGYGGGYRAVPFRGYGWNPNTARYVVVYSREAMRDLPSFDYEQMENRTDRTDRTDRMGNSQ